MKDKLFKSALIALGGAAISIIPVVLAMLNDEWVNGGTINWKIPMAMFLTAVGTWLVNTIKLLIQNNG